MPTPREKFIEELIERISKKFPNDPKPDINTMDDDVKIVFNTFYDVILEDRKVILSPTKEALHFYNNVKGGTVPDNKIVNELVFGIEETLKLARLDKE